MEDYEIGSRVDRRTAQPADFLIDGDMDFVYSKTITKDSFIE